ncbi:MAG: hypothetical protein U1D30_19570 [Planctomycetota bacterium]
MITDDMTDEQIEAALALSRVHKLYLDVQRVAIEKLGLPWVMQATTQWNEQRTRFGNDDIRE